MSAILLNNASTIALSAVAIVLFQTSTLVIGGYLAKDLLAPFYQTFPEWWQRMLLVILPLPGLGNLLAAQAFTNPIVAGISFLVFGNWAVLIAATYIGNAQFDAVSIKLVVAISLLAI